MDKTVEGRKPVSKGGVGKEGEEVRDDILVKLELVAEAPPLEMDQDTIVAAGLGPVEILVPGVQAFAEMEGE